MNKKQADNKKWYAANKEHVAEKNILRRYGLHPGAKGRMYLEQGGKCALCDKSRPVEKLHIDHGHESGNVRGLICLTCNVNLGIVENKLFMEQALKYLKDRD